MVKKDKIGPVEVFAVVFPGNQFKGEIIPALKELIDNKTIRIIDMLFVTKDRSGEVRVREIHDMDNDARTAFTPIITDLTGLLEEEDAKEISKMLDNNSSAAVMLFEDTWAMRFRDAVASAKGEVMLSERIPREVIDRVRDAAQT